MLKNDNIFRDFLFALALIGLIRFVYQEHAETPLERPKQMLYTSKESSLDDLFKKTDLALKQSIKYAEKTGNRLLKKDLDELKNQWKEINQQYYHKIKQEDAITYLLGPIYSIAKVSKEHTLKNRLNALQKSLTFAMQQQVDILQENKSSYIASAQM